MVNPINWTCPYCNRVQTVTNDNRSSQVLELDTTNSKYGPVGVRVNEIACANPDCMELTLSAILAHLQIVSNPRRVKLSEIIDEWKLRPYSLAKPQPDYVPAPLREDYYEACKIRDLSPKASATLSRRCLQGMIRDFCGITKSRLVDEIRALEKAIECDAAPKGVSAETIDALHQVRELGNIGAHMEKDINLIVDVDAGEAQAMIELLEMLFEEWYVARHSREERLKNLSFITAEKDKIKKGDSSASET